MVGLVNGVVEGVWKSSTRFLGGGEMEDFKEPWYLVCEDDWTRWR